MKIILTALVLITFSISIQVLPALAANKPPEKGEALPVINLPVPKNAEERNYLGLSGGDLFKIPQIKARAVIVELFSMYCPFCQKDAARVNELYRLIESNPLLKNKIKLIGIGLGNSPYEVEVFKKTYDIPFPLFPDKDFVIHKVCGEVRTPYYMVVKINEDGTHQIVHTQLGNYPGADPFLGVVLEASGLNREEKERL
ncbi:MAG TPA: TlpA family protein disulfide reductase [Thermodesulfobacteriota bacterium]|jgi:peroxiredoxin|nr:TlpA family protein disulfide reductase [Thermodesulfobacteriota bacterium]